MSAIGDYIHLHAWNYMDYGINKIHEKPSANGVAALKTEKQLIRSKVAKLESVKNTTALERELNQLIDFLGNGQNDNTNEVSTEAAKVMEQIISSSWKENVVNRKINLKTMNVTSSSRGRIGKIGSRGHYAKNGRNYENILKNRILELNKILTELQDKTKSSNIDINSSELNQHIKQVRQYIEDSFKLVDQYLQETNLKGGKYRAAGERDMIKNLNMMIKTYAPFLDDARQKGILFENVLALIPIKIQEIAVDGIDTAIRESVGKNSVGGNLRKVSYNPGAFIKGMTSKGNVGYEDIQEYNTMIERISESQQKIDVSFEYKGQLFNVSAKNIALGKNWSQLSKPITISNGNPLLDLLQDEDSDFVNHYLNVFAEHKGEGGYESHLGFLRNEYLDVIKMIIIYKGLTGDGYNRSDDIANVFIVNNNQDSKNHVRVINIKALVYKILRSSSNLMQVQWGGNVITSGHKYPNDKVGEDSDPWAKTGTARIAKLLQAVHANKIHAAIPAGTIFNLRDS